MIEETVAIEVAFAVPEKQQVIQLEVPFGTLIRDAVRLSCIESHFPSYDLSALPVGAPVSASNENTMMRFSRVSEK